MPYPHRSTVLLAACLVLGVLGRPAEAQVTPRFEAITAGAITFTGNALGLDTDSSSDRPGTGGTIGTFITTDTGLQDNTNWPSGTTGDFQQNRSEADLVLPAGATVLHAELVWGGSWADDSGDENVGANLQDPVQFTTPAGTQSVAPDPTFLVADPAVVTSGDCPGTDGCFYARSQDVTALVQMGGAGRYAVGGVPGTQSTDGGSLKSAGWTLAVVYEDFNQPFRNLTLFRGLARQGAAPAEVSGFCTPPIGAVSGRVAVSAIEGDANITGDEMRFGPTASLTSANRISGPRNPETNFFAGQITDDDGNLDTTGTFGDRNHAPGDPTSGARAGWDITNVDVSSQLINEETSSFVQGTTTGDKFIITTLGVQIDVGAPSFPTDVKTVTPAVAQVGGTLTYTVDLINQGSADANEVVFFDDIPPGTTFVPGTIMLDGAPVAGDLVAGVPIGTVAVGATRTVQFDVTVNSIPADALYANSARWTFTFVSCLGQTPQPGQTATNAVTTPIARIEAAKAVVPAALAGGEQALFVVALRNTGTAPATGVTLTDPIPAGVAYVPGTTRLNATIVVPDVAGEMPFAAGAPVNSPGAPAGQIDPGGFAVVSFLVEADPSGQGTITNVATIDPDGPGGLPPFEVTGNVDVTSEADLQIAKSGPANVTVPPGGNVTYTLTVTNNGPSNVPSATIDDPTPPGLTFVSATAPCAAGFPCTLGPLAAGASQTIMVTYTVPGTYSGPDPIANVATVTPPPGVPDPNLGNNTSTSQTAIMAPVMDLGVTKTDGQLIAVPGTTVTYTIVVSNAGPQTATDAPVADTFPTELTNPTWTCTPSAGASCPASGSGSINTTVTIPAGGMVTFTVTGDVPPDQGVGTLLNTVTVTPPPGGSDPNGGNNVTTDRDVLRPEADLSLEKTGPATAVPGETITYQLTVTNNGPSDAVNVRLFDPDQAGSSSVECPDLAACELGTIPAGESRTITVVVDVPLDVPVPGEITNDALVDAGTFDPNEGNNGDGHTATLTPMADLEITKSGPESVVAGTTVEYRITVTNQGPSIAQDVQVSDPTPPGLTFVSNAEACTTPFPCTLGAIPPGESRTIVSTYEVPPDYAGPDPVVNTATTTSPVPDPDPGDNTVTIPTPVRRVADIAVEKTADPRDAAAGDSVTYTITATNNGPSDATGVVVSDVLPAEETLTSATPSQGSYDAATGTWTVGDLPFGASATLTITATVNVQGQLRNTATKTGGNEFDPDTSNDSAGTVLNAIVADIGIDIVAGSEIAQVGEGVNFTITVVNNGPDPATNVVAHLGTVTAATFESAEFPPGTTFNPADFTWAIGNLAVGQSVMLTGVFTVTEASPLIEVFRTHTELDPNPANDRDFVLLNPLGDVADLQVTKSTSNEMPQVGERVSFTVTVRNNGPSPATSVVVQDPVPPGLTFVAATPSQGTYDPATGRWEVGPLGVNVSETLALTMDVAQPGTIVNTAVSGVGGPPDPNPNNNVGTVTLIVPPAPAADLSIVKTAAPDAVAVGEQITWTLAVANAGPAAAPDVVVTDIVPAQVSVVSATAMPGSCEVAGGQVMCALGELPAGATATVTIVATRTAPEAVLNTASVGGGPLDPDPGNNTSTVPTGPAGEADCGNCGDDDGDGLVDAEDPDCCAAETLTVTRTRQQRSRLQVKGRLAPGAFAGLDPRQEDVQLVLRDGQGQVTCCAVPSEQWRKVLGRTFWVRGLQSACPPVKSLCLIVPEQGPTRTVINMSPQTPAPLEITLSAGGRCVQGQTSSVRSRARGGRAVSP